MSDSLPALSGVEGPRVTPAAVSVQRIVKRYRLYRKPGYRFLDLFGLCPSGAAYYAEHTALDDVSLSVARGEKVAIIGRNGAGKSTLLKVITGLVRPSAGMVQVRGKVSNLLQIGSGFHPDFTGRQNVFASLAHQGIIGADADRIFKEVADFAEIGEYIDQPMKTYSTGMCSRLMFSSSVMTRPDVLIVDEILGVGDAYFSHKSFERMRQLCAGERTTLLLVTHDIYSALNLCDRFIWIDRGRIMFDGDGKSAISLYESSVKEQEEHYLRQRHVASLATPEGDKVVHVLVRSRTGFALPSPLAIGLIELVLEDGRTSTLRVSEGAPGWTLLPEGNLGPSQTIAGEPCRVLRPIGSIYHKAEWVVTLPPDARIAGARVRFRYDGDEPVDIRVFNPNRQLVLGGELTTARQWQESRFDRVSPGRELEVVKQTNYGTGLVQIVGVQFLDSTGRDVVEIRHGVPFTLRARLRVRPDLRDRDVALILGFARHESPYSAYVYEPRLTLPPGDECVVEVRLESVQLGSGQWYVNIGIGEIGLYDRAVINYFTVDAAWYHMLAARLELRVTSATSVDTFGCFFIHPATVAVLESAPVAVAERTHAG
jgi:ABC-type polysaccharide/polyol phosphate transport system ATPase subunit